MVVCARLAGASWNQRCPVEPKSVVNALSKQLPSYGGSAETAIDDVKHYINEKYSVVVLAADERPAVIVDMSTSDVARTRELGERLAAHGITLVDAPVARLRQAAQDGTLLITRRVIEVISERLSARGDTGVVSIRLAAKPRNQWQEDQDGSIVVR